MIDSLTKQNKEVKDQCEALKTLVHRLNIELSRYRVKYAPLSQDELTDVPIIQSSWSVSYFMHSLYIAVILLTLLQCNILTSPANNNVNSHIDLCDIIRLSVHFCWV